MHMFCSLKEELKEVAASKTLEIIYQRGRDRFDPLTQVLVGTFIRSRILSLPEIGICIIIFLVAFTVVAIIQVHAVVLRSEKEK